MNKKIRGLTLSFVILLLPLISAQTIFDNLDLRQGVNQLIDWVIDFGSPVFEVVIGDYSTNDFFFGKVLLLILLVIIIKTILDKTPIFEGNKNVSIIASLIISVLGIRFINENSFFEAIFVQYGVLGIAITTVLPLVIFFYFVHNTKVGTFGRKVFWAIYAIILGGIWVLKSDSIPAIADWIYGLSMAAVLLFLIFDKTIHGYLGLGDFRKFEKKSNKEAIYRAKERIVKLNERYHDGIISHYEYRRAIKEEEDRIKELSKD